jgi:hypothetical protein
MFLRILAIAIVAALCGCATSSDAGRPPWEGAPPRQDDPAPPQTQLSQRDECAAACQAKYDRCTDDSAKERSEPHTNCYEDLRDCTQRCDAAVASDPTNRPNQGATVSEGAEIVIGNAIISGTVPVISKDRR